MIMPIILLYAGQYQIVDEKTGTISEGVTCNYYFNTDFSSSDNTNGTKGSRPAKGTLDFALFNKIVKAPALYNADFDMSIGSDMKPILKIKDLTYVDDVNIVRCHPEK